MNGWSVNWAYAGEMRITNLWNANMSGANPYIASDSGWNGTLQPGQSETFGFQGRKPAGDTEIPEVSGNVCN